LKSKDAEAQSKDCTARAKYDIYECLVINEMFQSMTSIMVILSPCLIHTYILANISILFKKLLTKQKEFLGHQKLRSKTQQNTLKYLN